MKSPFFPLLFFTFLFPRTLAAETINFQPTSSVVPIADKKDDGSAFTLARGYGWTRDIRTNTRDRGNNFDPLKRTLVFATVLEHWKYILPNGEYLLTVVSGDYSFAQGPHKVVVEGVSIIAGQGTSAGQFITVTDVRIAVTDGQLDIDLGGLSGTSVLNYLNIKPAPALHPWLLHWTDMSSDETYFLIERRLAADNDSMCASVGIVDANTITYTDTTALAAEQYCYRVLARSPFGESLPSSLACTNQLQSPTSPGTVHIIIAP